MADNPEQEITERMIMETDAFGRQIPVRETRRMSSIEKSKEEEKKRIEEVNQF
jgi:hypothetical protein